jgi:hypothetical protein
MLKHTWQIHEKWYIEKIDLVKNYLHLQKLTFNILLESIIWKFCSIVILKKNKLLVNWKHKMY